MSAVTVCLTNWQRPDNLSRIIKTLLIQHCTVKIFLWNNGKSFYHPKIDWLISSSQNMVCLPRWFMAANAQTEFVCILDDDLFFEDEHILGDIMDLAAKEDETVIFGPTGVCFDKGKSYLESKHLYSFRAQLDHNVNCDMIKGSMMFLRTNTLNSVQFGSITDNICDDIAISSLLSPRPKHHVCLTNFKDRFRSEGDDEFALWRKPDHYARRSTACKYYFPHYFE